MVILDRRITLAGELFRVSGPVSLTLRQRGPARV